MPKILNINKFRPSSSTPPDIDCDFAANPFSGKDRHDIFRYLQKKYNRGKDIHAALVGVRSVYSLKSALRDVCKTFSIPASETFAITKIINDDLTIVENRKRNREIDAFFSKYPELEDVVEKIKGTVSNFGVHAGGIIISDRHYPINRYCAIQKNNDGEPATLWDKDEIQESLGFVKYDILQATALSQIMHTKYLIGETDFYDDYKEEPDIIRELTKKGHHKNIFQFEKPLGRRMFQECKISSIYDLSNASGMIRLMGTEDGREMYEKYKHNSNSDEADWRRQLKEEVSEENYEICFRILKPTYGVLIYQEQLSEMIKELSRGKATFGDGNIVRKKLGKLVLKHGLIDDVQKDKEKLKLWHKDVMDILHKPLLQYLNKDGYQSEDPDVIDFLNFNLRNGRLPIPKRGILNWFIIGSTYLFSVIHSVAYSIISFNQIYQKYYYPVQFWCSTLFTGSKDDIKNFIDAAYLESGIKTLRPDINHSDFNFKVEGPSIRFGLGMISGVNKAAMVIIQERKENGYFKSFSDFYQRTRKNATLINKKIIENLIFAGSFGDVNQEEIYREYIKLKGDKKLEPIGWSLQNMIEREREVLDVNLSYQYENTEKLKQCLPINELKNEDEQMIAFVINKVTKKKTKNKKDYTLLGITCMNSKNKINLFAWDNGSVDWQPFLNQPMAKYIKKSNDFYTVNLFRQ